MVLGHLSVEKSSSLFGTRKMGPKTRPKICSKIRPQIRPFESDAATSAGTLEASEPCHKLMA